MPTVPRRLAAHRERDRLQARRLRAATVEQALLEGATANGFTGELWTLEPIAMVAEPVWSSSTSPRSA